MDKRISYKIVLDTETCPLDRELDEVTPSNMFAYDIGWAIVDKRGNVYKTRSFMNADIFLNDRTVSREHAQIIVSNDTVILKDLGSLNGTYLDGKLVDEAILASGEILQIGTFQLQYLRG